MENTQYTTLYIVRHGQTEANVKDLLSGQSESSLTQEGRKQARVLAETLKGVAFDVIFSSDLSRATQTAEIIKLERKLIINTNKLLRERNFGKHEGKDKKVYREENKDAFEKLQTLTDEEKWNFKTSDDIESDQEIAGRLLTGLREIAVTYPGKTVLVVGHGGTMRALLAHLGWASLRELPPGSVKNAGYVILESDGIEFIVREVHGIEKSK